MIDRRLLPFFFAHVILAVVVFIGLVAVGLWVNPQAVKNVAFVMTGASAILVAPACAAGISLGASASKTYQHQLFTLGPVMVVSASIMGLADHLAS